MGLPPPYTVRWHHRGVPAGPRQGPRAAQEKRSADAADVMIEELVGVVRTVALRVTETSVLGRLALLARRQDGLRHGA